MLAHALAVSAPRAWTWKTVVPSSRALELTDEQYRTAARMNLRLQPTEGAACLPDECPFCQRGDAVRRDRWHFISCDSLRQGEVTMRHDAVVGALYHAAMVLGVQAVREPKGLAVNQLRPDLRMVFPGQQVLVDVVVSHPLAPAFIHNGNSLRMLGVAKAKQTTKRRKYAQTAAQHNALMLPFSLETCGGMAPEALRLLKLMGQAGEEHLALWPRGEVVRYLVGAVAMAVQREIGRASCRERVC